MADAAVGFLLARLKQLLLHHADLIHGLEYEVQKLQEDLLQLKRFTNQYSMHRHHIENEILKVSMKQIKKLVNKAEDAVDTSLLHSFEHKSRSQMDRTFLGFDYAAKLRSSAKEIKFIREKIRGLIDVGMSEIQAVQYGTFNDRKEPVVEEENVVGFDEEAKALISHLMGGSKELNFIFVTGMTGVGKTTLAKRVLNDEQIRREFDTCVFTYVSQDYDQRNVFLDILGSFIETRDMYKMATYELAALLHDKLRGRKYLIILDDVCTKDALDELRVAFPKDQHGRVMVITQNMRLSHSVNPSYYSSYNMTFFTLEESRELLRTKLFGKKSFPLELEEFEFHIAQNCRGLPLAVVAIAELLVNKRNRIEWWKKAQENVNFYVMLYQERTLSFNDLPDHLKLCFLYLGFFPEGFQMPVWKLFRLWIAEGFIQMNEYASLEDVAEMYLDELVSRNLVMVKERKSNGKPKTCQIHDSLRELCKKVAAQENLFHEIVGNSHMSSNPLSGNQRCVFVNSSVLEYISSEPYGLDIRSFLSFAKDETILPKRLVSSFLQAFKLLRVLDIKSIGFTHFPSELCRLILLKYVAISGDFKSLPRELSNLWNIQTLIIETSSPIIVIEADIWKMIWLRHLHTNCPAYLPCYPAKSRKNEEASAQLQTFSRISPESCRGEVFASTPNLKKLGICGKLSILLEEDKSNFLDNLGRLCFLQNLKLLNDDASFKLHRLPEVHQFPPKLRELTLSKTVIDWKHISTLARLENLEVLKLKDNAFMGEFWQTEDGGFRTLKVLHIQKTNLEIWKASAHHLPDLRCLVLAHCRELKAIPSDLADIPRLQRIKLYDTNPSAISSARKIQLLKLQNQAKQGNNGGWFKLTIDALDQCSFKR